MTERRAGWCLPEVDVATDRLVSRFVRRGDACSRDFIFTMPEAWWSRPYEYHWAASFCEPDDVALDAASGVPHPFKFYLVERGNQVHMMDIDPRIVDDEAMRREVRETFGADPDPRWLERIDRRLASLDALPYADRMFDKVYCISVLEHLRDLFNKFPGLLRFKPLLPFARDTMEQALREFRRVLKDDGLIVLTFDHPRIHLDYLQRVLPRVGLDFAGPVDFSIPGDALHWDERDLRCVRVVLRKRVADQERKLLNR